ncbi:MAG: hypothetical protein ABI612_10040 [Betaproteobacteria bacterium]
MLIPLIVRTFMQTIARHNMILGCNIQVTTSIAPEWWARALQIDIEKPQRLPVKRDRPPLHSVGSNVIHLRYRFPK